MPKEVPTRDIREEVQRELWARSAGRCQFKGCNRILYKSPITQERVNISEKAHIYSFSKSGPRGHAPLDTDLGRLNDISNLMLVCHDCHKTIDQDKEGKRYSDDLLKQWKEDHERRIYIVTGISSDEKSHVVMYGANIGAEKSPLQYVHAAEAMFPNRYPAEEKAISLSMSCEHDDSSPDYWKTEVNNLCSLFTKQIEPRIKENNPAHFSIYALAPQPLLIKLGVLFTDKISVDVYQLHREPRTWRWQPNPDRFDFIVKTPENMTNPPALIVSLSGRITPERIESLTGTAMSIWELTVPEDCLHNDFLKSREQLSLFRKTIRKLMVAIKEKHGQSTPLHIFPAMPVSCAIEFGRVRMPKADMPWIIYDQNNKESRFVKAIEI